MSRKRIEELLQVVDLDIKAHKAAGRLKMVEVYEELVDQVRKLFSKQRADQSKRWKKWYAKKGKDAQLRKKIREATRETDRHQGS